MLDRICSSDSWALGEFSSSVLFITVSTARLPSTNIHDKQFPIISIAFVLFHSPYFRRRSGALEGIFVASSVGVVSGVYIFKPLLDEMAANQKARKEREALESAATPPGVNPKAG
jgi:hypothetical protein